MSGSLSKYWKQKKDSHGNELFWPGTMDGFPVRGQGHSALKREEYENIPLVRDANARYFVLPKELDDYLEVIDKAANGWFQLRHERVVQPYDPDTGVEVVFLQWLEIHGEIGSGPEFINKDSRQKG